MQNAILSSSFFEESRIKALSLQKEGEEALLLWLRLFFAAVREDGDGKLMLYGTVAHDEKSISAVYGLPIAVAKTALELLIKFDLLVHCTDHYAISHFAELQTTHKRERHRKAQQKYVGSKREECPAGAHLTMKP